jgi:hypothetical protein
MALLSFCQSALAISSFQLSAPHPSGRISSLDPLRVRILQGKHGQVVVQSGGEAPRIVFQGNIKFSHGVAGRSVAYFGTDSFLYALNFSGQILPVLPLVNPGKSIAKYLVTISDRLLIRLEESEKLLDHFVVGLQAQLKTVSQDGTPRFGPPKFISIWTDSENGFGFHEQYLPAPSGRLSQIRQMHDQRHAHGFDIKVFLRGSSGPLFKTEHSFDLEMEAFNASSSKLLQNQVGVEVLVKETLDSILGRRSSGVQFASTEQMSFLIEYVRYLRLKRPSMKDSEVRSFVQAILLVSETSQELVGRNSLVIEDLFPRGRLAQHLHPVILRGSVARYLPYCDAIAAQGETLKEFWSLRRPVRHIVISRVGTGG